MPPSPIEPLFWSKFKDKVQSILDDHGGTHDAHHVLDLILRGDMQWWPGESSFVVTQMVQYPKARHCVFFLAGGDLKEIASMLSDIIRWARQQGCNRIEYTGRDGWALKGIPFRKIGSCMIRDI